MRQWTYILFFLMLPVLGWAQPSDAKIKTIDGKKYYIHEVEAGNTLYGIHKLYSVTIESIVEANPGADEGLQIGQELKIPVDAQGVSDTDHSDIEPSTVDTTKVKGIRHEVQRGETVFGISRQYDGVKARDILDANPGAQEGIQPGQILIIPTEGGEQLATDDDPEDQPEHQEDDPELKKKVMLEDSIIQHVVKRRETLYSLAKRYMVTQEELKVANDGLPGGLRKGDTILIPLKKVTLKDVLVKDIRPLEDTIPDTIPAITFKDVYEVAVFLPLYLDENDRRNAMRKPYEDKEVYPTTEIAVGFYKGLQFALDSLAELGISTKLHVFDTEKDTAKINGILNSEAMEDVDLIIGPFFSTSIKPVARWAKANKIHMVVPVPHTNKMLFKNPYVSKVVSSPASRVEGMARHIARIHHDHNIIVVDSKNEDEKYLYKLFKETLDTALTEYPNRKGKVHESFLEKYKMYDITSKVDGEDTNVVVVPSLSIGFVSNIMTRMNRLANSHQHYDTYFKVYGFEEWEDYNSVDIIYKHELHLNIAASTFIDYDTSRTVRFIRKFRKEFGTDPDDFAFMGFDVAFAYIAALSHYGSGLPYKVGSIRSEGVHTRFDLQQVENDSGFENKSVYILEHEDFDLIRKN